MHIINEWLWADAIGDVRAQQRALRVVSHIATWDDQIAVLEGSAFDKKMYRCCKASDQKTQGIAALFLGSVRQNSDRCVLFRGDAVPDVPAALLPTVKDDDHYLVQLLLACPGAILVTSDQPLLDTLIAHGHAAVHRDTFVAAVSPL